ncbi:YceI family protein [Tunturiibacter lichenicola]|uniref:YceI family protein n=1 Tax=Tunturiibacter lichenicola TaxID=2051959 RepID=UPI003D9ABB12
MKKKLLVIMFALFVASALSAAGESNTWSIDPMHTQATFEARHLSMTNIRGGISKVTGTITWDAKDPSKDSVNAVLIPATINTGSDYRDQYLKGGDFFNVGKFPTLTFKSTSVAPSGTGLKVIGDLTLAGVTKSVVLDVTGPAAPQKGMEGGLVSGIEATTTIKRTDFNFGSKYPNAMVSDEVKITIDLEMAQK